MLYSDIQLRERPSFPTDLKIWTLFWFGWVGVSGLNECSYLKICCFFNTIFVIVVNVSEVFLWITIVFVCKYTRMLTNLWYKTNIFLLTMFRFRDGWVGHWKSEQCSEFLIRRKLWTLPYDARNSYSTICSKEKCNLTLKWAHLHSDDFIRHCTLYYVFDLDLLADLGSRWAPHDQGPS